MKLDTRPPTGMVAQTVSDPVVCFTLEDASPGSDSKYVCCVDRVDTKEGEDPMSKEQVKELWINEIHKMLDVQKRILDALQCPISYQKELTKEL